MSKKQEIIDIIVEQGMLPLYFNADEAVSIEILKTIYKAGIKAVEYTNRGEAALKNFKAMVALRDAEMPGLKLGIGTIKNLATAEIYVDAGADFMISPGFVKEVAEFCNTIGMLYAPGCICLLYTSPSPRDS